MDSGVHSLTNLDSSRTSATYYFYWALFFLSQLALKTWGKYVCISSPLPRRSISPSEEYLNKFWFFNQLISVIVFGWKHWKHVFARRIQQIQQFSKVLIIFCIVKLERHFPQGTCVVKACASERTIIVSCLFMPVLFGNGEITSVLAAM